jgi:hypothetical protein
MAGSRLVTVFGEEVRIFKNEIHRAILKTLMRDGFMPLAASPERMTALLYTLVDELIMATAAANLILQGTNAGSALTAALLDVLAEGVRIRTLQLRHAVDEMSAGEVSHG